MIQSFNQPYPGSMAYLQQPRLHPNWGRARNYAAGAIGPAIGLSPMAYGIPFPGYPSLAEQPRVGVSPQEAQSWQGVYAAQMHERMANPDWCPSSITTTIGGKKWCYDPKTGGWICAEASGNCDPDKGGASGLDRLTAAPPARKRRAAGAATRKVCPPEMPFRCRDGTCAKDWTFCRDRIRNRARVQNGCYHAGKIDHPGRAVVACRMKNPGPHGEAIQVGPFCPPGACGSHDCGPCDQDAYATPGRVRTVLDGVTQAEEDVAWAMNQAEIGLHEMYRPQGAPWSTPNLAVAARPGGPPPINPVTTAQWQHCLPGPAVAAYPSANNPGVYR